MRVDFRDKVVVITGASSGIGAALAEEVGSRGARLVLAARREARLSDVARRSGAGAMPVVADVTSRRDVEDIVRRSLQAFGGIDFWVNNAGRGITRRVEQLSDDDVDVMFRDNVKSALYGMQAVLPHFKERGRGVIVNVSSMLSRAATAPARSAYSAAKAALNILTESLRAELEPDHPGITVQLVLPGIVSTDFGLNALGGGVDSRALPGGQTAAEVARIIADGMLSRRCDVYTRADGLERVIAHISALAASAKT